MFVPRSITLLRRLKIENKGGVDIDDVNAEHGRNSFELIKTVVKRINVKKKKKSIRTLEKRCNINESQFPSIVELSKNESNLEDYNLFPKDYNDFNAAKIFI